MASRAAFARAAGIFRRVLGAVAVLAAACAARAAEGQFGQRLEWRADGYAMEYRVEIQPESGAATFITTEDNFVEVSLQPGSYRYRVHAYDFLGRESSVSAWTSFDILKANMPEIEPPEEDPVVAEDGSLVLDVAIADVAAGTVVELVNEETGQVIAGTLEVGATSAVAGAEVEHASRAQFQDVPPGEWTLRVTNPSGLSSEAAGIAVQALPEPEPEPEEPAPEGPPEEAPEEPEDEEPPEEPEPAAEEPAAEEPEESADGEPEEPMDGEPEPPVAEQPRRQKKPRKPYANKDVNLEVGAGLAFSPYDGALMEYNDPALLPSFTARLSWFPVRREKYRLGIEADCWFFRLSQRNGYLDAALSFSLLQGGLVYQHRLFSSRLFWSAKAGGGAGLVEKNLSYLRDAGLRPQPSVELFGYPALSAGLSLFWIPARFMVVEAGADAAHLFVPGAPTGFVLPYVCVGLRL